MAQRWFVLACAAVVALAGCSGDEETATTASTSSGTTPPEVKTKLVVNEISAIGEDWVELANGGAEELDLSGIGITDQLDDGTPKYADTMRFPSGTKLAVGEYIFIRADLKMPLPGEQTMCLTMGGPASCYQAAWGISDTNGDKLFLLSSDNQVLSEVAYPPAAVTTGQTYCRIPSGIGNFVTCEPTPDAANKAAQ